MRQRKCRLIRQGDIQITIYPKTGRNAGISIGTNRKQQMSCRQMGGFLNRYNFAYAGRDIVNQVGKIAPDIINKAAGEINKIAQQRIDQVVKVRWGRN